jgi:Ser/Thr protein kinase RdoA (MazF antagonist)
VEAGSVGGGVVAWCRRWLVAEPVQVLFRAGYLSQVTGLRLADGRAVVLKARPPAPRLRGCVAVQATLAAAGFPCPRPLAGPAPLGALAATAEELVPGGHLLAPGPDAAGRFAALLAQLVRLAPDPAGLPTLAPSPPWAAWDHDHPGLWPPPDDRPGDLNADPGPPWLDRVAAAVRTRLAELRLPPVAGHADWESQNLRWDGDRPLAVHDWDSAVAQPEAVVAGLASAVWPAAGGPAEAATVEQSEQFLTAYEQARGRPWKASERQACWAAGLWVRAFNAKKERLEGGSRQLDLLAEQVTERSSRAGLDA